MVETFRTEVLPPSPALLGRRPLTVAHVTAETGFSGGEVQLFLLMEGLRKRGHENVLLCPRDSRSALEARRRGLDHRPIRAHSEWSARNVWDVRRRLRSSAPDLVHLHTGRANWLGGLATWQLGLPAVTTRRMDRPVKRNLRTRFVYGVGVQRAVAISRSVRQQLLEAGVPGAMIRVIPSAVDPGSLFPQVARRTTRAALGLDDDTPCLLTVASLVPRKGIDVLLDAAARLTRRRPRPLVLVAGDGPGRATLVRRARRLGLARQVRFLGRRRDVADLLAACDLFVQPSRQEGLGVAALEAMAAGRAVVATRVGGLAEAVAHEVTGLLVDRDDPAALAATIARLLDEPALRARLGRAGRDRVEARFLASPMVAAYENLYLEVLDEAERL